MGMIGKTLSHFRIIRQLGAGGMGVVYLARDTRLDRDVAIKMLPKEFARDSDRLTRFKREAKVLAALNHPNIGAIYGLEEPRRGVIFLVLEWVEGETLATRLRRGPLPPMEALAACAQIAGALAAAHERGVIHLDLKPANVMLTPAGHAKVLDFGLARRVTVRTAATTTTFVTKPGGAMGTPGYASPEQVRGEEHDGRADIFAFGCLLYECLTGKRAFSGDTAADVLAATLKQEPDWSALPLETPIKIRDLLQRCLRKQPQDRPRNIGDARIELDDAQGARPRSAGAFQVLSGSNNLPYEATSFVGRATEIAEGRQLLDHSRLLTLTGVGGCGKTRLAQRLAKELSESPKYDVWFVDLAHLAEGAGVVLELAVTLGVREEPGRPISQTIVDHLRPRRGLILLDNCEHMRASCSELAAELLPACPEMKLLVTSRERLDVPGEQMYEVKPLSTPDPKGTATAASISTFDAVRLFIERAVLVRPAFQITDSNAPAVAEICRRLDGIPLAIELAAARVRAISPSQIGAKLNDRFRLLASGSSSKLPRHQTLRAALQWSYDQLTAAEQQLFGVLAVFSGGWTLEAAAAVSGDGQDDFAVLDLLASLVDKSLVVVTESSTGASRYRFLETVREFALQAVRSYLLTHPLDSDVHAEARRRHSDFFLSLAETAAGSLEGPAEGDSLLRISAEQGNCLEAFYACLELGNISSATRLLVSLAPHWVLLGQWSHGRSLCGRLLELGIGEKPSEVTCEVLNWAGTFARCQGDYTEAALLLERAQQLSAELGYTRVLSQALVGLGNVSRYRSDYEYAEEFYGRALRIERELGRPARVALVQDNLGLVAYNRGQHAKAEALFSGALGTFRNLRISRRVAACERHLGLLAYDRGDMKTSRLHLEESLLVERRLVNHYGIALTLANLALVLARQGEVNSALDVGSESLRIRETLGDKWGVANSLLNLSQVYTQAGDLLKARHSLRTCLEMLRTIGDTRLLAFGLEWAARLSMPCPEAAARLLAAAAALRSALGKESEGNLPDDLASVIHKTREELGGSRFDHSWSNGLAMSPEEAIDAALGALGTDTDVS
jgi:non-specific serine/threonine protein kinase